MAGRLLGTMVACGFRRGMLAGDLTLAARLGAGVVELFPDWRSLPDPELAGRQVRDAGLGVWSAHGCWGAQSVRAERVDLSNSSPGVRFASIYDLKICIDWIALAGGARLVIHPGGLAVQDEPGARRAALLECLGILADHAAGTGVVLCVENMPPGVDPGSRMADLAAVVAELGHDRVALALDTGHARISADPVAETLAAGSLLATTHVHDNNGRKDTHLVPGLGVVDWPAWARALDAIHYEGPVMLECIRALRQAPDLIDGRLLDLLRCLTGGGPPGEAAPSDPP